MEQEVRVLENRGYEDLKSNNQKTPIIFKFVMPVVLIAVGGMGGYLLGILNQQPLRSTPEKPTDNQSVSENFSDQVVSDQKSSILTYAQKNEELRKRNTEIKEWVIYKDPTYSYTLKYPKAWYFMEIQKGGIISNYDEDELLNLGGKEDTSQFTDDGALTNEIKIDFVLKQNVNPDRKSLQELSKDQWSAVRKETDEVELISSTEFTTTSGIKGFKEVSRRGPSIFVNISLPYGFGNDIFYTTMFAGGPKHVKLFEDIIKSFRGPEN